MKCPGSIAFCADIPRTTSKYAEEGTAAHALAELCLTQGKNPWEQDAPEDMRCAVATYLRHVRETQRRLTGSALHVEQAFHLDWLDEELWGTNDAVIDQPWGRIAVLDYKHGVGYKVEAEGNVQCLFYALGAIHASNGHPDTVEIHIVQPRASGEPVSVWTLPAADVVAWGNDVLMPAVRATRAENAPLNPGDHCQFCPGRCWSVDGAVKTCPAIEQKALEAACQGFGAIIPVKKELILPVPEDMIAEQVARLMDFVDLLGPWIKAVQEECKKRMLAGKEIPGWKMVEGRRSRSWKDEAEAAKQLSGLGSAIFKTELLSVAAMEKLLKENNGKLEILKGLVEETRGATLAPATDKRPAVALDAVSQFTKIGE
jgi:hypothetical protein